MKNYRLAIIGRPNVGKSTLFNTLLGERKAIIDSISGVTRDRNYGTSYWNGSKLSFIDTGGYVLNNKNIISIEISKQIFNAIKESDIVVFVVDMISGLLEEDKQIAITLRKFCKKIILVINKIDNTKYIGNYIDFFKLGFKHNFGISAITGLGTGELLDNIINIIEYNVNVSDKKELLNYDIPRLAIIGRPNVGKSTLFNTLLGEYRYIVTEVSGTTRDAIESYYNRFGMECILIDTAGVKKKSKVNDKIEYYSIIRSINAIEKSDICLLVIDAVRGFEKQDMNILTLIKNKNKGIIIIINKWDLIDKDKTTLIYYKIRIKNKISHFNNIPIIFVSALQKERILKMIEISLKVYYNIKRKIKTSLLNKIMLPIIKITPPQAINGTYIKITFCTQIYSNTPKFVFFSNNPSLIKESYKKFLENQIRKKFEFQGVPIKIDFRQK
jgi:GTPase